MVLRGATVCWLHRCSLFLQVVQKLTLTCVSGETPQNAIRNSFVTVGTEVWKRSSRHHFLIERVSKSRHGLDFNLQSPFLLLLTDNTRQKLLVQLFSHKCRPNTITERRDWSKQGDDGHYTAGKRSCRRSFVFWESRSGNWKSRWLRFEWSK